MYLTHLSLTDFRIFSRFTQDIPRSAVILVGDNAQGKTSLLEAVYYLSALDSFQASSTSDLINFSALKQDLAVGRILAEYSKSGRQHELEIRLIRDASGAGNGSVRREVLLDGTPRKITEVIGVFNAVIFLPQMLQVVTGSPKNRRRYLNLTLAQVDPGIMAALSEYNKALTQRNALLKQLADGRADSQQLAYWDEILTRTGSYLISARMQAVQELGQLAAAAHQELTRGEEVLRLQYQPSYDPLGVDSGQIQLPIDAPPDTTRLTPEAIEGGYREKLLSTRSEDIMRRVTTIGPHRDELRFFSNGVDLGTYGSRGQLRTSFLAVKLAEVSWLHQKNGDWPVLLLDEVLAELDDSRRQDLLSRLSGTEQALLTTTDLDLFSKDFRQEAALWHIKAGRLEN